eukprot:scaffold18648_cov70-Phaeocystis_antarctica.AAC.2
MALFLLSFWDSSGQEALVLVALQIIGYFAFNPSRSDHNPVHASIRLHLASSPVIVLRVHVPAQSSTISCAELYTIPYA